MTTVALTAEQYTEIIETIRDGKISSMRPNPRIAAALMMEAQLGIRIGDVCRATSRKKDKVTKEVHEIETPSLRLSDIIRDGGRYRLNIVETKTGKPRHFTVTEKVYCFLRDYADAYGIGKDEELFPFTVRAVQKRLKAVCDVLEYENISTHSFRKYFATSIYKKSGYNVALVSKLMQHSSPAITQRYLNFSEEEIEAALAEHNAIM